MSNNPRLHVSRILMSMFRRDSTSDLLEDSCGLIPSVISSVIICGRLSLCRYCLRQLMAVSSVLLWIA